MTTDFGTSDGYVGAMKGEILRRAPGAQIVDLSHDIAPQDVAQGAWCLRRAAPAFPEGTIHVAVVDPGVGTERRGLLVETEHFLLLGPDNGLLMWAAERDRIRAVREIETGRGPWRRSPTFDGLSLFAVAAGQLMAGQEPDSVGSLLKDWKRIAVPPPHACQHAIEGEVMAHDRFGNAITNIPLELLGGRRPSGVEWGGAAPVRLCAAYHDLDGDSDSLGALWNSDGQLELFSYAGSARERFQIGRGQTVRLILSH